jgi:hypothetical protein
MKSIQLSETDNAIGYTDPLDRRYFADGKRITREEFDRIKREAVTLDCINTYQVNGLRHFDSCARFKA